MDLRGSVSSALKFGHGTDRLVRWTPQGDRGPGFTVRGDVLVVHLDDEGVERLLRIPRECEVMFEFPVEILSTGTRPDAVRGTMIAETDETLQRGVAALPDEVDVVVERVGPHSPDEQGVSSGAAPRQQEVLETAIDRGYYESPRRATHAEIAEGVELEPSTVSKHLRRIEAKKLTE